MCLVCRRFRDIVYNDYFMWRKLLEYQEHGHFLHVEVKELFTLKEREARDLKPVKINGRFWHPLTKVCATFLTKDGMQQWKNRRKSFAKALASRLKRRREELDRSIQVKAALNDANCLRQDIALWQLKHQYIKQNKGEVDDIVYKAVSRHSRKATLDAVVQGSDLSIENSIFDFPCRLFKAYIGGEAELTDVIKLVQKIKEMKLEVDRMWNTSPLRLFYRQPDMRIFSGLQHNPWTCEEMLHIATTQGTEWVERATTVRNWFHTFRVTDMRLVRILAKMCRKSEVWRYIIQGSVSRSHAKRLVRQACYNFFVGSLLLENSGVDWNELLDYCPCALRQLFWSRDGELTFPSLFQRIVLEPYSCFSIARDKKAQFLKELSSEGILSTSLHPPSLLIGAPFDTIATQTRKILLCAYTYLSVEYIMGVLKQRNQRLQELELQFRQFHLDVSWLEEPKYHSNDIFELASLFVQRGERDARTIADLFLPRKQRYDEIARELELKNLTKKDLHFGPVNKPPLSEEYIKYGTGTVSQVTESITIYR